MLFIRKKLTVFGMMLAVASMGLVGCGQTPMSPDTSDLSGGIDTPATEQKVFNLQEGFLTFAQPGIRAAKISGIDARSRLYFTEDTKAFSPEKESSMEIRLDQPNVNEEVDVFVQKARLTVLANSMDGLKPSDDGNYWITMRVISGTTLSDVAVQFNPSGLTFTPAATLSIKLLGPLDLSGLEYVYHVSGDGSVTKVRVHAYPEATGWRVDIEVPGFSKYVIDD